MPIDFKMSRDPEEVAKQLAVWLQDWFYAEALQRKGIERTGTRESWGELPIGTWGETSTTWTIAPAANDYKLDVLPDGHFRYRDRYHPPERMEFLAECLRGWDGCSDVVLR